jgi:DNA-binding CsgD family transcriptional regulator
VANDGDELAAVVDLLGAVAELDDLRLFPSVVLPKLAAIIPSEALTYNEIDLGTARSHWTAYPLDVLDPDSGPILAAYIHEHPIVRHVQRTADETPRRISDLASMREFHALGLYNELFKPNGIEYQMAMTLCDPAHAIIGIAFNRKSRDFTDRERDIAALLRSPLATAFERLGRRSGATFALCGPDVDLLTERERQVLELVAAGRTDRAIGHLLGCSARTIGKHLQNAYRKLGVTNRVAAVARIR